MWETMWLGPTPAEEDCSQAGREGFAERAERECRVYKRQLERTFPIPKELQAHVHFAVRFECHDFGEYPEVVVFYDGEIEAAVEFAFSIQERLPRRWDDAARAELADGGNHA